MKILSILYLGILSISLIPVSFAGVGCGDKNCTAGQTDVVIEQPTVESGRRPWVAPAIRGSKGYWWALRDDGSFVVSVSNRSRIAPRSGYNLVDRSRVPSKILAQLEQNSNFEAAQTSSAASAYGSDSATGMPSQYWLKKLDGTRVFVENGKEFLAIVDSNGKTAFPEGAPPSLRGYDGDGVGFIPAALVGKSAIAGQEFKDVPLAPIATAPAPQGQVVAGSAADPTTLDEWMRAMVPGGGGAPEAPKGKCCDDPNCKD